MCAAKPSEVDSNHGVIRMTIESAFHNKYSLVKGAARRARQLQSGASPLIVAKSMKACRVAQDEIRQGHVTFALPKDLVEPVLDVPSMNTPR
jgi:DNA-directed RNA polymerase subunit omega